MSEPVPVPAVRASGAVPAVRASGAVPAVRASGAVPAVRASGAVLTFGETMASLRAQGPMRLGGTLRLSIAGAETNVAIGLARLGTAVEWFGAVGDDELGALVVRTLRAEGVRTAHIRTDPDAPTGLIFFEPRLDGLTRVTYRRAGSAGASLSPADVDAAFASPPDLVHVTGVTPALSPTCQAAVSHAVSCAADAGSRVCLDVNYRRALWSPADAAAVLAPLAAQAQVVVASEDELELVTPEVPDGTEAAAARALLDTGVAEVVVTRGAGGATAYTADGRMDRPAVAVTSVDPVGAGDAFAAGYLSALLDDLDVAGRLDRAVRTAAFAVGSAGDWEGLPTRSELALLDHPSGTTLR
jgi:2-dehydro-3-deoxygluconokinase